MKEDIIPRKNFSKVVSRRFLDLGHLNILNKQRNNEFPVIGWESILYMDIYRFNGM